MRKSGEQARHPDGEARRRHRLATKTRDEAVVTAAAPDRAEAHRTALVVNSVECQLNFTNRPSIIFEAAHDGRVNTNSPAAKSRGFAHSNNVLHLSNAIERNRTF